VVESEERGFFFFAVEERHIPEDWHMKIYYPYFHETLGPSLCPVIYAQLLVPQYLYTDMDP
jgi:hypothetical protein